MKQACQDNGENAWVMAVEVGGSDGLRGLQMVSKREVREEGKMKKKKKKNKSF